MSAIARSISTYLNYGGNCRQAFEFYEQNLGGKITAMMTHGDQPGVNVPEDHKDAILFARLAFGDTAVMGSDMPAEANFQPMRSAYLYFAVSSTEQAERVYTLLAEGGQIFMPMDETFFAHRFGMLRDRFGTSWMVIHERPMPNA
jgi:PhnB protein